MTYTIDEIKEKITPIAEKYHIPKVYLFGSYANNNATDKSDIDLIIDSSTIDDYVVLFDIEEELEKAFGVDVDLIEYDVLNQNNNPRRRDFNLRVKQEMLEVV
jgi:predicted nucleotidyltransferase